MASTEKLVECIFEGKTYENDLENSHLNDMYKKFSANAEFGEGGKLDIFGKDEFQRIQQISNFFEWIPVPDSYFTRFQKCAKIASSLRDKGNQAYLAEDYEKALRAYNLAVAFARPGEPELALAYEKRADLFLTLNEPDLAQRDINLAAVNAYPKKSAQKLIELQNRCAVVANRKNAIVGNNKAVNDARRFCQDKFFRLKTPHPKIQNVEEFVEIDYRNECGRRVIVTKDVPAGTVMLLDAPYSFVLENLLNWDTEHCHHCTMPILGGIPCHSCTFAWFCSDSCLAKASKGIHKYEHRYLSYLHCHPTAYRVITTARTLFTAGPEELYNIFKTKDPLYFKPQSGATRGFNSDGIYEINSYLPIYHLISHPPSNFLKDISDVFKALLMTHLIDQTTNFFRRPHYTEECGEADFKIFIASVFLRQMRSFEFNAITLSKLEQTICPDLNNNPTEKANQSQYDSMKNMKTKRYGAAVYPVLCLLNHSCDPNAVPVRSLKYSKTSVVALKSLKRGDEICISYTPIFTMQEPEERLKYLYDRYNFYCSCDACNHMLSNKSRTNVAGYSHCDKCHRYLLTGQCPPCAKRDKNMPKIIANLQAQSENAEKMITNRNFKDAEKLLATCLRMCENFSPCFSLYIDLQFLYKRALVGLFNQ